MKASAAGMTAAIVKGHLSSWCGISSDHSKRNQLK